MKATIFERYGGFSVVHRLVLSFYEKMLGSDIVASYFDDVDMAALIDHQTKFISQVMGGPVVYSNEILEQVHKSLGITPAAFDEMTGLLERTLEEFEVKPEDVKIVMDDIRSRRHYIVTRD